jgi:hypothetical protein
LSCPTVAMAAARACSPCTALTAHLKLWYVCFSSHKHAERE